jgi:16S rRNA processing protein RimM
VSDRADAVAVGRVTRVHGVHGEVSVLPLSEVEGRFEPGSVLSLGDGRRLTIERVRTNRGRLLVFFREIPDRTAAEALPGEYLLVEASEVPAAPEGAFWPHQLVGSEVVTDAGRSLGTLVEVIANPANDLWVARSEDGAEVLIPALRDVVVHVDLDARRVTVRPTPGLLRDNPEPEEEEPS